MKRIVCVIGTRPEAIKLAPVVKELQRRSWADVHVIATAQHRELLDSVLELFGIETAIDLDIMSANQSLSLLTSRLFAELAEAYDALSPDLVLAQGDTTTVMASAMTAFYKRIKFGHVEAGLRTHNLREPFPEELNRVIASVVADFHFAPTQRAADALRAERIDDDAIFMTGNTVIDALMEATAWRTPLPIDIAPSKRVILLTLHRRENFGQPMMRIFEAVQRIARQFDDVEFVYPVHPNPNVAVMAHEQLGPLAQVHLIEPLAYDRLVATMKRADIVLTDSGGIQEEAPALAKPVLVLRNKTERPEAVEAGVAQLVGTQTETIVGAVAALLTSPDVYAAMAAGGSPYGDGTAARRIADILEERLAS